MTTAFTRLIDRFEQQGKERAKAFYRRPVIQAAALWRRILKRTRFIGVTGSAGKTTTKDLLHVALASTFRCVKNSDSNNQLYSIARTLIDVRPSADFCVQEIGASEPGAFDPMLTLLRPSIGVVTNVGVDHLSAFRTAQAVAEEKGKLIACLPPRGIAVLNADDDLVAGMASRTSARVVTYGLAQPAQFTGKIVSHRWPERLALIVRYGDEEAFVQTRLLAPPQASSVLAALATACSLGVPLAAAAAAVSRQESLLGRMSVHETSRGITFIRDDWKAPLWSLDRAFQYMERAQAARKIIVIGTISDHNGDSSRVYARIARTAMQAAQFVVMIGPRAVSAARRVGVEGAGRVLAFETVQDAAAGLGTFYEFGDLVLLKGSNRADHLGRLALAADHPVNCWAARCGRLIFCDHCRLSGKTL